MSREGIIKAVAGALQPKALDLTQYARAKSASRERETPRMREDEAAGALAFASTDRELKGEKTYGDPLAAALLHLKYADQHGKRFFDQALAILLHRHGGLAPKKAAPSAMLIAVATVAIFEWMHDSCTRCRARRAGARQPQPCPACRPTTPPGEDGTKPLGHRRLIAVLDRKTKRPVERIAAMASPEPGCPKCGGMGRIFQKEVKTKGVKCIACRGTGRAEFKRKRRWLMVSDLIVTAQRDRGVRVEGVAYETFFRHWSHRYYRILDVLRATDREIVAGVDVGFRPSDNRATEQKEYLVGEEEDPASDDPKVAEGRTAP